MLDKTTKSWKSVKQAKKIIFPIILVCFGYGLCALKFKLSAIVTSYEYAVWADEEIVQNKNLIGAISYLNRAVALTPGEETIYVDMGDIYLDLGQYKFAYNCYKFVVSKKSKLSEDCKAKYRAKMLQLENQF